MTTEPIESEFAEILATIAGGLGIAAERIFGIFVSAQVVIGIIDIVSVILILSGSLFFGWYTRRLCIKWWRDEEGDWEDDESETTAIWFPIVVAVIALFVSWGTIAVLGNATMMILCPDYTAMCEIIGLVTP